VIDADGLGGNSLEENEVEPSAELESNLLELCDLSKLSFS